MSQEEQRAHRRVRVDAGVSGAAVMVRRWWSTKGGSAREHNGRKGGRKKNARGSRQVRGGGWTPGTLGVGFAIEGENAVAGETFRNRLYPVHRNSLVKARSCRANERDGWIDTER